MAKVDCDTLRLTQSFRFGDNIADVANQFLTRFLEEKTPIIGTAQSDEPNPKRCVICRTNAGLFNEAISAVRQNQRFSIVGEQRFQWLLNDVLDIFHIFSNRPSSVVNPMFKRYRSIVDLEENALQTLDYELQGKCRIVTTHQHDIPEHVRKIRLSTIDKASADICLVTGHQAKGLEWDHVTLSSDFPSLQTPGGKSKRVQLKADRDDENFISREEINLYYVACTRAKRELEPGHSVKYFLNKKD
jgi:superfamily I DNA/RNA helicase